MYRQPRPVVGLKVFLYIEQQSWELSTAGVSYLGYKRHQLQDVGVIDTFLE
jgi:hypothetical protein